MKWRYLGLAVALAACNDGRATQYTGTVRSDASPESQSSMRLTVLGHSDTSFSAVLDVDPPMKTSGSVYGRVDGAELGLWSVGQRGDTIAWSSKRTGPELGGRFEIVGGPRAGETGTWRAAVTSGPAISEQALRTRGGPPLPPLQSTWTLLILAGILIAAARWVTKAPTRETLGPAPTEAIGGWLILFIVGQFIVFFSTLFKLAEIPGSLRQTLPLGLAIPGFGPLVLFELGVQLVQPFVVGIGIALLLRKSPRAPRFWFVYLAVSGAYAVFDPMAVAAFRGTLQRLSGDSAAGDGTSLTGLVRQVGIAIAWCAYWAKSIRVRDTFGIRALDPVDDVTRRETTLDAAPLLVVPALPAPVAARPRRSRSIRILRFAGGIAGSLLVFLVIGLAVTMPKETPVAPGADIRDVVAGRWSWSTETPVCGKLAHRISFGDSGRTMIISATPSIADTTSAYVYDILETTPASIRGAIRGETRMTAAGKPVVWDLVLTGADEYRWHRTDWPRRPWSYTGKIIRCP